MAEKSYADRDVLYKLGVRDGMRVRVVGPVPDDLRRRVDDAEGVEVDSGEAGKDGELAHVILWRFESIGDAKPTLARLRKAIAPDGAIWVLTGKRGRPDYVQQERLIPLGKAVGLVDNKSCSVDDETSAIRFVIPLAQRERVTPGHQD